MRYLAAALVAALVAALAVAAAAAPAAPHSHQHGLARLDVAVDGTTVSALLMTTLDDLVGFERAPRDDAERQRLDAAAATMRDTAAMIRVDPVAQCTSGPPVLRAPMFAPGQLEGKVWLADVVVEYTFRCTGAAPAWIEVGFFTAFARPQRLEVQIAGPKGQAKRTLRRPATRIDLSPTK